MIPSRPFSFLPSPLILNFPEVLPEGGVRNVHRAYFDSVRLCAFAFPFAFSLLFLLLSLLLFLFYAASHLL